MKTTKLRNIIPILLVSLIFSCNSKSEEDAFLGKWISTDTKDSISAPFEIYKTGEHIFVKVGNGKKEKEFPATYDEKEKVLNMDNKFKFYYLADSNYLKLKFLGNSGNLRKITEEEVKKRFDRRTAKYKADSIKINSWRQRNPFKDYKNHDAEILNNIIKNRKHL